jgi:hypothetical protein
LGIGIHEGGIYHTDLDKVCLPHIFLFETALHLIKTTPFAIYDCFSIGFSEGANREEVEDGVWSGSDEMKHGYMRRHLHQNQCDIDLSWIPIPN